MYRTQSNSVPDSVEKRTGFGRIVYRTQSNSIHKKTIAKVKISEKLFLRKNKMSPLLKTPEKVFQTLKGLSLVGLLFYLKVVMIITRKKLLL